MKTHCKNGHRRSPKNVGSDGACKLCKDFRAQQNNMKPKYRRRNRKYQQRRRVENQIQLFAYLAAHPCVDCGETDLLVLEFDHVKKKSFCVASLMSHSWKGIYREIKKCDVVCANDHRRRTAKRANTLRWQMRWP